jgi:DNA-binding transcriptional LysR family regulator
MNEKVRRETGVQLFVRAVEADSQTEAARALGIIQPTVSKQIPLLEERLGEDLGRNLAV